MKSPKIKILFLSANPLDSQPLQLAEEMRAIDQALRMAKFRDRFVLEQHGALRVSDLQELLLRIQPHIVHFSGHGTDRGELLLQDDAGNRQPVSVVALETLFALLKDNIRCVVLNACYSEPQAQAIANHVDCVIGMSDAITDEGARAFSASFYSGLAYGRSVLTAFELAKNMIDLAGLPEQDVPRLVATRTDPKDVTLVDISSTDQGVLHDPQQILGDLIKGDKVGRDKVGRDAVSVNDISGVAAVAGGHVQIIHNYFPPTSSAVVECADIVRCPYKGLAHFGPEDADLFFGREKVTQELVQLINKRSAIPILGASGSGKSSLVLAGLVPALQRTGDWQFVHFRPGSDPFLALAKALVPLYEPNLTSKREQTKEARAIADDLRNNELTIIDIIDEIKTANAPARLLLIADQFEELYTLCPNEQLQHQFLDNLIQSCQPIDAPYSSLVIVFTLRTDFLTNALNNPSFADVLRSDVKLGPMTQAELRQVIARPAQRSDISFEDGLVERILQEVEHKPGNLPLLEFALSLLWEQRADGPITHHAYEAIGQVEGALARHANVQYERLTDAEKEQTQYVFTQLVHPGQGTEDTRQIAIMEELDKISWPLIRKLADLRLVVTSQNADGQETVEVVHEALIRHWGKLEAWMNEIREFRVWQEQLRFELSRWRNNGRDEGALLRGRFLEEAEEWLKERSSNLGEAEQEFIQASINHYNQEQQEKKEVERNRLVLTIRVQGVANLDLREADLRWAKLQGANLSEADLQGADLSEADLQGANLREADLQGANLQRAELYGAYLNRADLSEADLQGADLSEADLHGANLQGAKLKGADLSEADLQGAKLQGAVIDDTTYLNKKWYLVWQILSQDIADLDLSEADLSEADLQGAKLKGAKLKGAKMKEADLRWADLSEADLSEVDLPEADLQGADLRSADLQGADLRSADLQRADLRWAKLQGADLSRADLQRADLRYADLQGVDLTWVDLQGAKLSEADLRWADLSEADLSEADLHGAKLGEANLQGADLQRANLQGADLQRADLQGADLQGADLTNTKYDNDTKWPDSFNPKQKLTHMPQRPVEVEWDEGSKKLVSFEKE